MPYKRKYKKRTYRKKKKSYRARKALTSNYVPSGMPVQRVAKLRYVEQITLQSVLGNIATYVFSANDVYDPNHTGTGHQPMGFDQWAILFNHYTVLGSRCSAKVAFQGSTVSTSMVGMYLTDGKISPYTDSDQFQEARKGTTRLLSSGQSQSVRIAQNYSAKKFHNVTDVKDNTGRLGASVSGSPTEEAFFNMWCQTKDGATKNFTFIVEIDYIVSFSEPKDLTQS